jgi:opacity protein-like surface antigen
MTRVRYGLIALTTLLVVAPAWTAAWAGTGKAAVEITPFYGYRFGGDIDHIEDAGGAEVSEGNSYGIMVDIEVEKDGFIELRYSRQSSELKATDSDFGTGKVTVADIDVDHWMVGGTYQWEVSSPVRPFVSADLGVVHFSPQGSDGETRFAFGIGAGVKLPISDHLGLRFDGRWVASRLSGESDFFCSSNGSCLVVSEGTFFDQFEFTAGLSFKF